MKTKSSASQKGRESELMTGDEAWRLGGWSAGELASACAEIWDFPKPVRRPSLNPRDWVWDIEELREWIHFATALDIKY
jgi:hypothetical protein